MKIKKITLNNFRNYANQTLSLGDNLNVIVGENAQGKTNLIESVFLCAIGRSPRTNKDKDLIEWNSQFAKVDIEVEKNIGNSRVEMFLFRNQNKAVKINQIGIQKIGQLLGVVNAIYFSPDELKLIKDSPDERRKFMDISLCQFDKNYFYDLSNYNKILQQRNKLLKSASENVLKDTIVIWNEQLATSGAKIIMSRLAFVENLKPIVKDIHKMLTNDKEELVIEYQGYIAPTENELKLLLLKKYEESLEKDVRLGYTTVGPHRDDIKIVSCGIDLRSFGSQGQQRTAAITLKLAELEVFKNNLGEYPVLLLDDVLSELDDNRQRQMLKYVSKVQTLITCTSFDFDIPYNRYEVSSGSIVNVQEIKP